VKRWFDPITVSKIFILSRENVLPTLSQYIDPDNIPKKYGGNLDFVWGSMPVLEPEIQAAIKWEHPEVQEGKNTLPIGPIRWETAEDGSMVAVAVGMEKGQPRRRTVFTIPHPVNLSRKEPVPNTAVAEAGLHQTTAGTYTQPSDADVASADINPPPSDSPALAATPTPFTAMEPQPESKDLPIRAGTSETRYAQQEHTHASGQLEDGTPHSAVNDHGHGDKSVTMEPATVGQAPKEVNLPQKETPAPGYLDQAKQVASQAATTVSSTVTAAASTVTGLVGGSGPNADNQRPEDKVPEKTPEQKALDSQIDTKEAPAVEDFLRSQTGNTR
jgi:hypothetical protein